LKIIIFTNTDWYLYNFRYPLAKYYRQQGHEVVLMTPPGDFHHHFVNDGFRWIEFDFNRRSMNPVTELISLLRILRVYRVEKPDLLLHFTIKCVLYGSLSARLLGLRKVINSITGLGHLFTHHDFPTRMLRLCVVRIYRFALKGTRLVFQNSDDENVFRANRLFKSGQNFLVPGSGADLSVFKPVERNSDLPVVLLASRMMWDKGVGDFVEAARLLHSENVKARFVLVGASDPGNPASISAEQLKTWDSEGMVSWWGFRDDMAVVLREAHIVCLPTYYREGLPKILIEAAASGLPIVTTDIPGCRGILEDGVNGIIVPVRNPQILARALKALIEDPDKCREMGLAGREIVAANYSIEKVLAGYAEVTESLIP